MSWPWLVCYDCYKNQVVVTENVWPIESKIFTTYPLQKKRNETNNNNQKKTVANL